MEINRCAEVLQERGKPLRWNKGRICECLREQGKWRNILESWALGDVIPSVYHGHTAESCDHWSMITSNCLLHIPFSSPQIISSWTCPKRNSSPLICCFSLQRVSAHWHHSSPRILGGAPPSPSPGIQSVPQPSYIHPVLCIPTDADLIPASFCFLFLKFHVGKGCQQTPNQDELSSVPTRPLQTHMQANHQGCGDTGPPCSQGKGNGWGGASLREWFCLYQPFGETEPEVRSWQAGPGLEQSSGYCFSLGPHVCRGWALGQADIAEGPSLQGRKVCLWDDAGLEDSQEAAYRDPLKWPELEPGPQSMVTCLKFPFILHIELLCQCSLS